MKSVYIIAEAGVNHNGDAKLASELIDAAAEAGANAIKFQIFKAENLVTKNAKKSAYQKNNTNSDDTQFLMLKNLELTNETHLKLFEHCKKKKIEYLASSFDQDSLRFLLEDLNLNTLKIASGEITNGPFILQHAMHGSNILLSTGMSTFEEMEDALGVIAFGLLINSKFFNVLPSKANFKSAFMSKEGQKILREKVTLLHCTSDYPAQLKEINLNAMVTMKKKFNLEIGYSDHSQGILVPIAATALGAKVIEKHFTMDKKLSGPDHNASLDPKELASMINVVRNTEKLLGESKKIPQASELINMSLIRKSIVARKKIEKGKIFTSDDITFKRPADGRSPMDYWEILNDKSKSNYDIDDHIE